MNRIIYEKGIFGFECTKLEICRNEKKGAVELCFTKNVKGICFKAIAHSWTMEELIYSALTAS